MAAFRVGPERELKGLPNRCPSAISVSHGLATVWRSEIDEVQPAAFLQNR